MFQRKFIPRMKAVATDDYALQVVMNLVLYRRLSFSKTLMSVYVRRWILEIFPDKCYIHWIN